MIPWLLGCGAPTLPEIATLPPPPTVCHHPLDDTIYRRWQTSSDIDPDQECVVSSACADGVVDVVLSICEGSIHHYFGADGELAGISKTTDTIGPGVCNPENWGQTPPCDRTRIISPGCVAMEVPEPQRFIGEAVEGYRLDDLMTDWPCHGRGVCEVDGDVYDVLLIPDLCGTPGLSIFDATGEQVAGMAGDWFWGADLRICHRTPVATSDGCGFVQTP